MQLVLDGMAQPLARAAPQQIMFAPAGARLRLSLGPDEELVAASLTLHRFAGTAQPALPAPALATSRPDGSLAGISWLIADWGNARSLRSISMTFASAANLRVRMHIARGGSAWFSPPGPHSFDPAGGTNVLLQVVVPDMVADRVMLELIDRTTGQPTTATLVAAPSFTFGAHARDVAMRVIEHRDAFAHAGELPAAGIAVPDLLATLRATAAVPLSGMDIELELRAEVAGFAALAWSFTHTRLVRSLGDSDTRTLSLRWDEPVSTVLADIPAGRPESIELSLAGEPTPERMALVPADTSQAVALLGQPLHDSAVSVLLALDAPLAGVDLWVRPLSVRVRVRVDICPDSGGQPADRPVATGACELALPGDDPPLVPMWIAVPLDTPVMPPSPFWLVVHVDEGELLWFLGSERPAGVAAPRHRRNDGAWLGIGDPGAWALTRLRVSSTEPPPPIACDLIFVAPDGSQRAEAATVDAHGTLRWGTDAPQPARRVSLRLRSVVATTLTLSRLRLAYRESP